MSVDKALVRGGGVWSADNADLAPGRFNSATSGTFPAAGEFGGWQEYVLTGRLADDAEWRPVL